MKVLLATMTLLCLTMTPAYCAVSLSSLSIKTTKKNNISERQLSGKIEAQMDAEDASKSLL
jgi:hypothetical protein